MYHKVDTAFLRGKYRFIIQTKQLPSCLCTETVRRASKTSTGDFQARGETVRERRRGPGRSGQRCRRVRAASVGSATSTCCAWRPTSSGTPPVSSVSTAARPSTNDARASCAPARPTADETTSGPSACATEFRFVQPKRR